MDQQNIKFLISLRLTCVTFANKMFIVRNVWLLYCIISLSIHYDINMSKNEYFEGGLTLLATTVYCCNLCKLLQLMYVAKKPLNRLLIAMVIC